MHFKDVAGAKRWHHNGSVEARIVNKKYPAAYKKMSSYSFYHLPLSALSDIESVVKPSNTHQYYNGTSVFTDIVKGCPRSLQSLPVVPLCV